MFFVTRYTLLITKSQASTSDTTHLYAPSSTPSIVDSSVDLFNTSRNDDEDEDHDHTMEFEEANETPKPAQSRKIQLTQEVEVHEGSERRVCDLRKVLHLEGDEEAELRKEAMPMKERIVDAWTVSWPLTFAS